MESDLKLESVPNNFKNLLKFSLKLLCFNLFEKIPIPNKKYIFFYLCIFFKDSTETQFFTPAFNNLLDKIGKNAHQNQQLPVGSSPSGTGSPNGSSNSIFTSHQPLSNEMISSFTLHVRIHLATYLSYILTQKSQNFKALNLNIPASIVETFARLIIFDPDNFMKYFTQNVWSVLINTNPNNLPQLHQHAQLGNLAQTTFLYQQLNLLIELICFRLKHLSFTHRTTFLILLNNLFTSPMSQNQNQSQQGQQQPQVAGQMSQQIPHQQQQSQRSDQINFIKHPIIYVNVQCAMLKLLSSFSGSDYIELLNSVYGNSKHAPKFFINSDSEELNKAIVMVIAKAVHLTGRNF